MLRPSRWSRFKEAFSQLLCVLLYDGDADEMLSSYAWRTQNTWLIAKLDWLLGKNHCHQSYVWEKTHYKVNRFEDA